MFEIKCKKYGKSLLASTVEVSKLYRKMRIEKCPEIRVFQPDWYQKLVKKENCGALFNRKESAVILRYFDRGVNLHHINWVLRKRLQLRQKDVCDMIGISRYWLNLYENGKLCVKSEEEIDLRLLRKLEGLLRNVKQGGGVGRLDSGSIGV